MSGNGGKRRIKKGKLERVPHLLFKLGGVCSRLFIWPDQCEFQLTGDAPLLFPLDCVITSYSCAEKRNIAILGRTTCCLMLQVKGQRVRLKSNAECVLLCYAMLPCNVLVGHVMLNKQLITIKISGYTKYYAF